MLARLTSVERRDTLENPGVALTAALLGGVDMGSGVVPGLPGINVTSDTALQLGVVYGCVRVITSAIAQQRVDIFDRDRTAVDTPVYDDPMQDLIDRDGEPNSQMTGYEHSEMIVGHMLLWGNAYDWIETDERGRTVALWPIPPKYVKPVLIPDPSGKGGGPGGTRIAYRVRMPQMDTVLLQDEVIHYPSFRTDGLEGLSPIQLAKRGIGIAMATEEYGMRFFSQDGRPGGVIQVPGRLSDNAYRRLRRRWEALHQGVRRSHFMAILEEGATWQSVGVPPEDSQFLQTRGFQQTEIAMWYGVPPHLLGLVDKTTSWGKGIEEQTASFVRFGLNSWATRVESKWTRRLFRDEGQKNRYARFRTEDLERGDMLGRFQAYQVAILSGFMSPDDARRKEGQPPIPGGKGAIYLQPGNAAPLGSDPFANKTAPDTTPADDTSSGSSPDGVQ